MLRAAAARPFGTVEANFALTRAQAGDPAAFEEILAEHQGMVFSLAYHFLGDTAAAEELAQEVFLELFRRLTQIQSAAHLKYWLRRVTTHRCIDRLRRANPKELAVAELPDASAPADFRDILLEERLRRLVAELSPSARAVVILRYQEDLDPADIAETLGMPVNTVKSHLRRSIDTIRAKLGQQKDLV